MHLDTVLVICSVLTSAANAVVGIWHPCIVLVQELCELYVASAKHVLFAQVQSATHDLPKDKPAWQERRTDLAPMLESVAVSVSTITMR